MKKFEPIIANALGKTHEPKELVTKNKIWILTVVISLIVIFFSIPASTKHASSSQSSQNQNYYNNNAVNDMY